MKLVYVAGPFRAPTPWQVEQNVRCAEIAALLIWQLGAVGVCPHAMGRFYDREVPDEVILEGTLDLLKRCDAIYLVQGWEKSRGANVEHHTARSLNIPVFTRLDALARWVKDGT